MQKITTHASLFNITQLVPLLFLAVVSVGTAFSGSVFAAPTEVTATVDKNPVMVDESFQLTITANDDVPADAFDSSVLMRDFVVGRTRVSRNTQMVNFNTTRSTVWTTTLIPQKTGQFTIPALTVAGLKTQPISINVIEMASNNITQTRDIFISAEVEKSQAYVQQQIKYTIRLHLAVDLQSGSLSQPELPGAEIEQVGKDREFTDIIDGKRFRIIERVFSIIPNSSGEFTIRGPVFDGEIIDNSRQSFGFFNRTRNVQRITKNIDVEVLPIPSNYNGHWLPSEFVQLTEEWQTPDSEFRVGAPATRTITLTAVGVTETQLPEIDSLYPPSIKVYPDQADTARVQRNGTIVAQRTETVALIPNEQGQLVLPEVSVQWFNIVTKQTETAVLPARSVNVLPPDVSTEELPDIPQQNSPVANIETATENTQGLPIPVPTWWSLSSWILLALWLVTLLVWWITWQRKPKVIAQSQVTNKPQSNTTPWQDLQKELMRKQPDIGQVQKLLPGWLATVTGKPYSSLGTQLDLLDHADLRHTINELYRGHYGKEGTSAGSAPLLKQLLKMTQQMEKQQRQKHKTRQVSLRPLYPTT